MSLLSETALVEFNRSVVPRISRDGLKAFQRDTRSIEEVFEDLLYSADASCITTTHKAAAYAALANFLDRGTNSKDALRGFCNRSDVFQRCFDVYLHKSEGYSAKPMQSYLGALVQILATLDDKDSRRNLDYAANICLRHIMNNDDPSGVKPSIIALELLLKKSCLSLQQMLGYIEEITRELPTELIFSQAQQEDVFSNAQYFLLQLLQWSNVLHLSQSACTLLTRFCKMYQGYLSLYQSNTAFVDLWMEPIRELLMKDENVIEHLENHILPDLFRLDMQATIDSLSTDLTRLHRGNATNMSEVAIRLCLTALKHIGPKDNVILTNEPVSRKIPAGAVSEEVNGPTIISLSRHTVATEFAKYLISHASRTVRTVSLQIIASAYTQPHNIPGKVLESLAEALPGFHNEPDAQARNAFFSIIKRLLFRVAVSISHLQKEIKHELGAGQATREAGLKLRRLRVEQTYHLNFVNQYTETLWNALQASAPYQRHISALKVMEHLIAESTNFQWGEIVCLPVTKILVNLVLDPFDDVRATAANILRRMLRSNAMAQKRSFISSAIADGLFRANEMMRQIRKADLADGFGRLNCIWFEVCSKPFDVIISLVADIENDIRIATEDLSSAVARAPIHGHLIALRYIFGLGDLTAAFQVNGVENSWVTIHGRLMNISSQIWHIVHPVLCIDSPEGNNFLEPDSVVDIGIKDTLSYAWRALKESSTLIHTLIVTPAYAQWSPRGSLVYDDYQSIGDSTFRQLSELRHRGAFSTVAQTFTSCCIACSKSAEPSIRGLLDRWYQEALACIEIKAGALTRRSAGIPSIIVGVFFARCLNNSSAMTVEDLTTIASRPAMVIHEKKQLPQVHAINCLKEICTNTRLASATEPHLPRMIELAARCLESSIWEIRNSGTMLLKAIITRLTAATSVDFRSKGRPYSKATYRRYPQLSRLVLHLLGRTSRLVSNTVEQGDWEKQYEIGFPALQIIRKIGVVPEDRLAVVQLLLVHLQSRIWSIRVQAARALATQLEPETTLMKLESAAMHSERKNNLLHGYLSCLQESLILNSASAVLTLERLLKLLSMLSTPEAPPYLIKSYLDVVYQAARLSQSPVWACSKSTTSLQEGKSRQGLSQAIESFETVSDVILAKNLSSELTEALVCTKLLLGMFENPSTSPEKVQEMVICDQKYASEQVPPLIFLELATCCPPKTALDARIRSCLARLTDFQTQSISQTSYSEALIIISAHMAKFLDNFELTSMTESANYYVDQQVRRCTDTETAQEDKVRSSQLIFLGSGISWQCKVGIMEAEDFKMILGKYAIMLQLAIHENSDFEDRIAAMSSLWNFRSMLLNSDHDDDLSSYLIHIYRSLMTALNDDDEEVRYKAGEVVSYLISKAPNSEDTRLDRPCQLEPVAAKKELIRVMTLKYSKAPGFTEECLSNVLGLSLTPGWQENDPGSFNRLSALFDRKPSSSLVKGLLDKNATHLFEEERANLFVDEADDAELWSNALISGRSISPPVLTQMENWLLPGLTALGKIASDTQFSALPISSAREIFVAGVRLLSLAQMIVSMNDGGRSANQIKELLRTIRGREGQTNVEYQWLRRIDNILA